MSICFKRGRQPALPFKRVSLPLFYGVVVLESMTSNFILPITPTIIKNLYLPDYLFGVSYAGMSLTCFLLPPFWAKISDCIGRVKVYSIGCFGYALAQLYFCFAATQGSIMAARILSGAFISGINICHISYLIDASAPEELGRNIVILSTLVSVFSALGYLVGGILGDVSIFAAFLIQVAMLAGCGLVLLFFLKDAESFSENRVPLKGILKGVNPFSALLHVNKAPSRRLAVLLLAFFLIYAASVAYDQSFNYYVRDQFGFPPSYNGFLKALMGFIALIANFAVCGRILKKPRFYRSFFDLLLACASLGTVLILSGSEIVFLISYLLFFSFNSVVVTLQQSVISGIGARGGDSAGVVACYNSTLALGSVAGAGAAGIVYHVNCKLPFILGAVLIVSAMALIGNKAAKPEEDSLDAGESRT